MIFICFLLQQILSDCSFTSNLISIEDNSSLEDLKKEDRPIFLRLTSPGCPYSPASQGNWEAAAALFPQVDFVTVNCWQNTAITTLFGTSLFTPYHGYFLANKTTLCEGEDTQFGATFANVSPDKFVEVITKHSNIYPISPPLAKLIPMTIDSFYKNAVNPIILLYDSRCTEQTPFLNAWSKAANEDLLSDGDYPVVGLLDCSVFPDECQRWSFPYSVSTPRALIYSGKTNNFEILESIDSITKDKIDSLITNSGSLPIKPTPSPIPLPPVELPTVSTDGYTILSNKRLQDRSLADVKKKYKEGFKAPSGDGCLNGCGNEKVDVPNCNEVLPNPEDVTNSIKVINTFRWLAGLPDDVVENSEWSVQCRKTAHNMHRIGKVPPNHIIDDRYLTSDYCGEPANKQAGIDSLLSENTLTSFESTYKLFKDEGANNDGVVGHRRYLLHPNLKQIGIGFHPFKLFNMQTFYMQRPAVNVIRIKDGNSLGYIENSVPDDLDFISWPPAGPFPFAHLPTNWHISHPSFRNLELKDLEILVTRDDGIELPISKAVIEKSNVNRDSLILIMSKEALKRCYAMRTINVAVKNTKDKQMIQYSFELFDLEDHTEVCFYNSDQSKCPSSIESSNRFGPGSYQIDLLKNAKNSLKIHVVEPITISNGDEISISIPHRVIFSGKSIKGKMHIAAGTTVDFQDPSETDFLIDWKVSSKSVGILDTAFSAKSIFVQVMDESEKVGLHNIDFYTGKATQYSLSKSVFRGSNKDVYYTFGGNEYQYYLTASVSDATENFLVNDPFLNYQDVKQDYPGTSLSDLSEMKDQSSLKRTIRVFVRDTNRILININSFLKGSRKRDYQFVNTGSRYVVFQCDLDIKSVASSIKFMDLNDRYDYVSKYQFSMAASSGAYYVKNQCPIDNVTIDHASYSSSTYTYDIYFASVKGDSDAIARYPTAYVEEFPPDGHNSNEIDTFKQTGPKMHAYVTIDGKYDNYVVKLDFEGTQYTVPYETVTIRPIAGVESKPVKIKLVDRNDLNSVIPNKNKEFKKIYFENFKDLTIDNPAAADGVSYQEYFNFTNCGKVSFASQENSDPITLDKTLYLSGGSDSQIDYGVLTAVKELVATEPGTFHLKNLQTEKLAVSHAQEFVELKITGAISVDSSTLTLTNCELKEGVEVNIVKKSNTWPSVSLIETDISSLNINIDLGLVKQSNSRLLADDSYESHILIGGLSPDSESACSSVKEKVTTNNFGDFELRCSEDDQSLLAAKGTPPSYDMAEIPSSTSSNDENPDGGDEVPSNDGSGDGDVPSNDGGDGGDVPSNDGGDGGDVPSNDGGDVPSNDGGDVPSNDGGDGGDVPSNDDNPGVVPSNDDGHKSESNGGNANPDDDDKSNNDSKSFPVGGIIGIVIGIIVVIAVIVIVVVIINKKRRSESSDFNERLEEENSTGL